MKLAVKLAAAASVALALTTGAAAMADPRHGRDDRQHDRWDDRRDRHDDRRDRWEDRDDRWNDDRGRRDDRYDHRHRDRHHHDRRHHDHRHPHWRHDRGYRHPGPYHRPYGYVPRRWHRGARLPAAYCAPRYVIHDHYAYRLRPPPRGHHWVRVDGDAILAAIATGIVLQVVDGYFG